MTSHDISALLIAFLLSGVLSCASPPDPRTADTNSRCVPSFPYEEGWLGGDAAYSILLNDGRTVWLFGDTFVGVPGQQTRKDSAFIHNSIAVSRCGPDSEWNIDYEWGESEQGAPQSFAHEDGASGYWWLFDGFEHGGDLYVGLLEIEPSDPRGLFGLKFRPTGMKLARVHNHELTPDRWTYEVLPLSNSRIAFPGSAMVIHGDYVYMFAFIDRDTQHQPRILARLPLVALADSDPSKSIEYLASDREWRNGLDADRALVVMNDNASEMSVRYHEDLGVWLAVYVHPTLNLTPGQHSESNRILLRVAEQLEGPWTEPVPIFAIPELERNLQPETNSNTVCYAAKEHPQFAHSGELLLTYVCNLFTRPGDEALEILERLATNMELYRPRVVSVQQPTSIQAFEVERVELPSGDGASTLPR